MTLIEFPFDSSFVKIWLGRSVSFWYPFTVFFIEQWRSGKSGLIVVFARRWLLYTLLYLVYEVRRRARHSLYHIMHRRIVKEGCNQLLLLNKTIFSCFLWSVATLDMVYTAKRQHERLIYTIHYNILLIWWACSVYLAIAIIFFAID